MWQSENENLKKKKKKKKTIQTEKKNGLGKMGDPMAQRHNHMRTHASSQPPANTTYSVPMTIFVFFLLFKWMKRTYLIFDKRFRVG